MLQSFKLSESHTIITSSPLDANLYHVPSICIQLIVNILPVWAEGSLDTNARFAMTLLDTTH